jgi:hypothetical protein
MLRLARFRAGEITLMEFFEQAEQLPLSELQTLSGLLMGGESGGKARSAGESEDKRSAED